MEISADDWRHFYFIVQSKTKIAAIGESKMTALLSMINVKNAIYTDAIIDPLHIANEKGLTPWLLEYTLPAVRDKATLVDVFALKTAAYLPSETFHSTFTDNCWPIDYLKSINFHEKPILFGFIPFIVPKHVENIRTMHQSLVAPDGSMEIMGVEEFDETQPERLLIAIQKLSDWIEGGRN